MSRNSKNLFDYFPDKSKKEVLLGISLLSAKSQQMLINAYGESYDDVDKYMSLSTGEKKKVHSIIYSTLSNKVNNYWELLNKNKSKGKKGEKENNKRSRGRNNNRFFNKEHQTIIIKKSKLSFYNEVSDDLKELYLNYYFEVFPLFKVKYENADEDEKAKLLKMAIENSKVWREKFVMENRRLIIYIANKYPQVPFDDAMQEGSIGMLTAMRKFDLDKDVKFSTYAINWIKREILKYANEKNNVVRTPINVGSLFSKIKRIENDYYLNNGRKPTNEEIAEQAECSVSMVELYLEFTRNLEQPLSLNYHIEADCDDLVDFIGDETNVSVFSELFVDEIREKIDTLIYDERIKYILLKRLGLYDGRVYTLQELADEFGLTREGVRQLQNRGVKSIKENKKLYRRSRNVLETSINDSNDQNQIYEVLTSSIDSLSLRILKLHFVKNLDIVKVAGKLNIDVIDALKLERHALSILRSDFVYEDGKLKKINK